LTIPDKQTKTQASHESIKSSNLPPRENKGHISSSHSFIQKRVSLIIPVYGNCPDLLTTSKISHASSQGSQHNRSVSQADARPPRPEVRTLGALVLAPESTSGALHPDARSKGYYLRAQHLLQRRSMNKPKIIIMVLLAQNFNPQLFHVLITTFQVTPQHTTSRS